MRVLLAGVVIFVANFGCAEGKFQPLNVKPGLWETTSTVTRSGEMPIPAGFLAKMTPEQRAKLEARMKASSAQSTRTRTYKSCETKEKLQRSPFSDSKECSLTVIGSTGTTANVRMSCEAEGIKSSGEMLVEAVSPEKVKGSGHMTATGGGHTMNMNTTISSRWVGSSCGNVQ